MSASPDFLASLKEGDLVAATVQSSTKLHLIYIKRHIKPGMTKGTLSEEDAKKLFDGRVLCQANPRFWWRPQEDLDKWDEADRCRWCFYKWRQLKRPAITGWRKPEATVTSSLRLPWGWTEVTPTGHPLDLAADVPDPDPEEKEEKVGAKRMEICRWMRGDRYVRITQAHADKRFTSRYGAVIDKADAEHWSIRGSWKAALQSALTIMALGGTPSHKTRYEKLEVGDADKD